MINFKKDSASRKTVEYIDKRLEIVDTLWKKFITNHEAIQALEVEDQEHCYFSTDYFGEVSKLKEKLRSALLSERQKQTPQPTASTSATTSAPVKLSTSKFKLNYADEDVSNEEVVRLIRRQRSLMKTVVNFIRDIEEKLHETLSRSYCEYKINLLQKYQHEMMMADQLIWENSCQDELSEYKAELYHELEGWLQGIIIALQEKLTQVCNTPNELQTVKLPKIKLPTFDGNYLNWVHFKELYTQLIHSQQISEAQKMFYLMSNLSGEARVLVQHLPVTGQSYCDAWATLCSRYDNKRLLVTAFLNKIVSQPTMQAASVKAIRSLHDTTKECILGLKNLGIDTTTWDPLLIHLLIKRLDGNTHVLYEQSLKNPRDLSTMEEFLNFLETRFQSLEALGTKQVTKENPSKAKHRMDHHTSAFVTTPNSQLQCPVCKHPHHIYTCRIFLSKTPSQRYQCIKNCNSCLNCLKQGHTASNCTSRSCTKCGKRHNTLLHVEDNTKPLKPLKPNQTKEGESQSTHQSTEPEGQPTTGKSITLTAQNTGDRKKYVFISTVLLKVLKPNGEDIQCRAVLDSGSQVNFITTRLAKKLALKPIEDPLSIKGIGEGSQLTQQRVNITVKSRVGEFTTRMEAYVLPTITENQPTRELNINEWAIPDYVTLADPNFHIPQRIELLIGAEHYYDLIAAGQVKLGQNMPVLQNTRFGWVVAGKTTNIINKFHGKAQQPNVVCGVCTHTEDAIENQLERFWTLEEGDNSIPNRTVAEKQCESHFNQTVKRDDSGRFTVRLPFAKEPSILGESKDIALARFHSIERKLRRNPELKKTYAEFMDEYLQLGHMEEVDYANLPQPHYFLPHHYVVKPDSTTTKLRVVFDAGAKTSTNVSLNDTLHTGPKIQEDLFTVLLRFRLPRYVFTADLEKMYRQILVDPDDRKYQLIWWRTHENQPERCYQLRTVTYGVKSAPYLAIKCLHRLASQNSEVYPLGASTIKRNFYVDDLMSGSNSIREALEAQEQLTSIMKSAGFKLRKWCANHPALLKHIAAENQAVQLNITMDDDCHIKTLGLIWSPRLDEFQFTTIKEEGCLPTTKRKVLSEIAHLFDSLGVLSPVVITAKIFLQNLWSIKLDWDAPLPPELHTTWEKFRTELSFLQDIRIPRRTLKGDDPEEMQLHAFSDASEKAYGAAIYLRSRHRDKTIQVRLLCAKSKVAPTKKTTLPRLELCAAKLAAQLLDRVIKDLNWQEQCFLWTDSTIVLGWINSTSSSYQTFVANRISSILEVTTPTQWKHVPSKHNPADLVSRGVQPSRLKQCDLWFYGPIFLHGPISAWPVTPNHSDIELERKRPKVTLVASTDTSTGLLDLINHRNNWKYLQRIVAYILRFIWNTRHDCNEVKRLGMLSVQELEEALIIIIKEVQKTSFAEDLKDLIKHGHVSSNSSLVTLTPFLDKEGVIRVGGRLEQASIFYDSKHPMLLPGSHEITYLLFIDYHTSNSHIGPQPLLSSIRQRFWALKGKNVARTVVQHYVKCSKAKPKMLSQLMGNLPSPRVQSAKPFVTAGVDFCGPFWTHFNIKGKAPLKSYVAIFCCFSTKAVRIEVVSDLTTESFIGALKRFIGRRGHCQKLYCDNATNFTGASNQLKELQQVIHSERASEKINKFCSSKNIEFHFIPPRAPHFGDIWEAAVKLAKHLFQRSVAAASLTYEELTTVMVEIEAILNSRPLTPMSNDPSDLTALTPGHFLVGEPLTSIVDPHANPVKGNLLYRWKLVSQLKNEFWNRWTKEYLCELQQRYKWNKISQNIQAGTMVILKEDNAPVLSWPLGRVIQPIKGRDDIVRVADVRTQFGVLRRPIHKLAPLPIEDSKDEAAPQSNTEDEEPTNESNPSTPKRRRVANSPISAFIMTCLMLPLFGSAQVTIAPFTTQPGLYFEGMGSTHLASNEWNLVAFFNMKTYWQELELIAFGTERLNQICQSTKNKELCSETMTQFFRVIEEIKNANELLAPHRQTRQKRAPLNIIGTVANSLFGILDSQYAETMSEIIENMEDNQQHLLELLKNHTSIIDSTANVMAKSQETIHKQIQEINQFMNNTAEVIDAMQEELQQQKLNELFNGLAARLILEITTYQRMQSAILDVIIHAHHGKVNPILVTPNQLKAQLMLIKDNLPTDLRLPMTNDHLLELYNIMTIESRKRQQEIIFRLRLPLITQERFEILRMVPVPILSNKTFITIEPSTEFIIINVHRNLYYPLSREELSQCLLIKASTHICTQHHPLYKKGATTGSCEISILTHDKLSPSCKISSSEEVPMWTQLLNSNHWIYVTKQKTPINIICGNTFQRKFLQGSGILNMSSKCIVNDEFTTLHAHNLYSTSFSASFTPARNITDDLHTLNLPRLKYQPISEQNITADIRGIKDTLRQFQDTEALTSLHSHHQIHHLSISYICLGIIIIVIGCLIWKSRQRKPPTPAPRTSLADFRLQSQNDG